MSDYETDLVLWSEKQAALLRRMGAGERVNDQVDWENVAEEIDSLGRNHKRELRSRLRTILTHLIKLQVSPAVEPRPGWKQTILRERVEVTELLEESPSLGPAVSSVIDQEIGRARTLAAAELAAFGEQSRSDPAALTYTEAQVLGPWLPD